MKYKNQKSDGKAHLAVFLVILILSVLITRVSSELFTPLTQFELNLLDSRFKKRGITIPDDPTTVIISISEESIKAMPPPYNSWPLPRFVYSKLIENLNKAGAAAIGIDLIMESPDRYSEKFDSALMQTIRQYGNVVVAGKIQQESNAMDGEPGETYKYRYMHNNNFNFDNIFFAADSSIGIVNIIQDMDGIIRRYKPFWTLPFEPPLQIPTFAFALLNKYQGLPYNKIAQVSGNNYNLGKYEIPEYDASAFLVNYYGPSGTFPNYDIINIIDDSTFQTADELYLGEEINLWDDPEAGLAITERFKDKVVLVGSFNPLEKDYFLIPFSSDAGSGDNILFGVELYANIIESVIKNRLLIKEPVWVALSLLLIFVYISFYSRRFIKLLNLKNIFINEAVIVLLTVVLLFFIYEASFFFFNQYSYVTNISGLSLAVILAYLGSTSYHFITERKQSLFLKRMFSQYVNKNLLDQLIADPTNLKLGGERKELTVFFSDIEGFTDISEKKDSEELVHILNEYLSAMTEIIFKNKGTLDKYIGDAIMAFWGAPVYLHEHAIACCKAALKMQHELDGLNIKWHSEGQPNIKARIGINTGEMVVGNMGGRERFDYTIMGDNVNLASRLEGVNKVYGTNIIISDSTFEIIKQFFYTRQLDFIQVKGRSKPVWIYELVSSKDEPLTDEKERLIYYFQEGLHKYSNRLFHEAQVLFEKALQHSPEDKPCLLFIDRCVHYLIEAPPEDWNGVTLMTHK